MKPDADWDRTLNYVRKPHRNLNPLVVVCVVGAIIVSLTFGILFREFSQQ